MQTAFLDAQRALERGTIPRNPRAWLAAIALNAAHRLRRRRLNAEPLEEYAVQEASRMSEIRAALASLPREQRAAVLYRDVLGLSYGETAEQMGTSVNAVTMLLHRGRQRLRQTLAVTVGGLGLWRWSKHAGMPQVAVVKGAAAVVTAAGLATTGIVAARAVAPIGTDRTAAPAPRPGRLAAAAPRPERVTAEQGGRLSERSRTTQLVVSRRRAMSRRRACPQRRRQARPEKRNRQPPAPRRPTWWRRCCPRRSGCRPFPCRHCRSRRRP